MDLTNEQWKRIEEFIPKPKARPGEYSGYFAQEHPGKTYQSDIHQKAHAIGVSKNGQNQVYLPRFSQS
jgi:hypothetical protein